jgi:hypothetical protein
MDACFEITEVPLSLFMRCGETKKVFVVSVACWVDSGYCQPFGKFSRKHYVHLHHCQFDADCECRSDFGDY